MFPFFFFRTDSFGNQTQTASNNQNRNRAGSFGSGRIRSGSMGNKVVNTNKFHNNQQQQQRGDNRDTNQFTYTRDPNFKPQAGNNRNNNQSGNFKGNFSKGSNNKAPTVVQNQKVVVAAVGGDVKEIKDLKGDK